MTRVLLLGSYRQTFVIARALRGVGYEVVLGASRPDRYNRVSRAIQGCVGLPPLTVPLRWIDGIRGALDRDGQISHVLPVGEGELRALARHPAPVPDHISLVAPSRGVALTCLDKARTNRIAEDLGVPVGRWHSAHDVDEVARSIDQIGFPCVVKGNDSTSPLNGEKAVILRSQEDAFVFLGRLARFPDSAVVQRFMNGVRHNCHFVARAGMIVARFEGIVSRTDRTDGSGLSVEARSVALSPELWDFCARLCQTLAYSGPGMIQFLRTEDGSEVGFLEFNPRLAANVGLPVGCGVNLPALAVHASTESRYSAPPDRFDAPQAPYRTSKVMSWTLGDLIGILDERDRLTRSELWIRLSRVVTTLLRADMRYSWSFSDPGPTVAMYAGLIQRLMRATAKRARRR